MWPYKRWKFKQWWWKRIWWLVDAYNALYEESFGIKVRILLILGGQFF